MTTTLGYAALDPASLLARFGLHLHLQWPRLRRRQHLRRVLGPFDFIRETQEMLDFCVEHDIVSDIEMIAMKDINGAFERMLKSDVRYRFAIDMATLEG